MQLERLLTPGGEAKPFVARNNGTKEVEISGRFGSEQRIEEGNTGEKQKLQNSRNRGNRGQNEPGCFHGGGSFHSYRPALISGRQI